MGSGASGNGGGSGGVASASTGKSNGSGGEGPSGGSGSGAGTGSSGAAGGAESSGDDSSGAGEGSSVFSRRFRRKNETIRGVKTKAALRFRNLRGLAGDPRRVLIGADSVVPTMTSGPSVRLRELGLVLPAAPKPAGAYSPVVVEGDRAWVSGQIAFRDGAPIHPGRVDLEVGVPEAKEAAQVATLQALSALASSLGSIDRIGRVLRTTVYVASIPSFTRQHEVANAATELLIALFGEAGRPARVSVGVASLPLNGSVEVALEVKTV